MNNAKMINNIPQFLLWQKEIYEFISNKHDTLLYGKKGFYQYEDCIDDDKIIVVEYRKDKPLNDAFYVLFNMSSGYYSSSIKVYNISNAMNRMAKPYNKEN